MTLIARLLALLTAIGTDVKSLFARAVPPGGTTNQVLAKTSNADFADAWVDVPIRRDAEITLTDAATIPWNINASRNARVTLGGNRTLSISNAVAGDWGKLRVFQDNTGSRTLTLPSGSYVPGQGIAATCWLKPTANSLTVLSFYFNGTNYHWTIVTY